MNGKQGFSKIAARLPLKFGPGNHRSELLGDLIEQLNSGRSRLWFWREVLFAVLIGLARSGQTFFGRFGPHRPNNRIHFTRLRKVATVGIGLLLLWFGSVLLWLPVRIIGWPGNWSESIRLGWSAWGDCVPVVNLVVLPLVVGFIIGRLTKGAEMSVTITLSLTIVALELICIAFHWRILWRPMITWLSSSLLPYPAGLAAWPIANVVGGWIARRMLLNPIQYSVN